MGRDSARNNVMWQGSIAIFAARTEHAWKVHILPDISIYTGSRNQYAGNKPKEKEKVKLKGTFAENRPFIEHEYQNPHWIENSGMPVKKLQIALREYVDCNLSLPMPIFSIIKFLISSNIIPLAIEDVIIVFGL